MKRSGLLGAVLCLSGLMLAAGCVAPDDETWIRITGIGTTTTTTTTTTTNDQTTTTTNSNFSDASVVESDLQSDSTDTADVEVQNTSVILGSGNGVSVTVYHATVEYFVQNQDLPSYQYVVTLFLPAPSSGEAGDASTTRILEDLPLVPAALKSWVLNPANFPAEIAARGFSGEARITLRARTEEGRELETSTGITVVFN